MQQKSDQKQHTRRVRKRIGLLAILAVVLSLAVVIVGGYVFGWDWAGLTPSISPSHPTNTTFLPGKTVWDWLQLLIIPAVLAGAALWFNWQQGKVEREIGEQRRKVDLEIAADQQREGMLQDYLNRMSELLLDRNLRESSGDDSEIQMIARARTLTVLRRLDSERKAVILNFLKEASLIDGESPVIILEGADLRGANLSGAALESSNLSMADLSNSDLSHADLMGACILFAKLSAANLHSALLREAMLRGCNMRGANLSAANLIGVNLSSGDLTGADLTGADLTGVDMWEANLTNAQVTTEQLATAKSLKGATMPDGSKHD